MGHRIDFIDRLHTGTKRNYVERVVSYDKAECAEVAQRWGRDYWDGDRRYGYGGYRYDGRWRVVAEDMARHYGIRPGSRILDVGCGKAFLLHEFTQVVPGVEVWGLDVSRYGILHAKEEVRPHLVAARAEKIPFPDRSFDFVLSINALHNLRNFELWDALQEIERVARGPRYVVVESYETERQKVNLLYWQLTCRSIYSVPEWEWLYRKAGYGGDYSFIFFD